MKKTLLIAFLLMFGLVVQVQAVSTNSNQGAKSGQADAAVTGNQAVNTVQTNEQNQVMNQGENTQIQTQEQNTIQTQNNTTAADKINKGKSSSNPSEQRRSQVANAVQTMLQVADREGGIGQQVRVIAQNQNQNQVKLEQNVEKIQDRGGFAKFFIGPNYKEIKDAQKTLEQNKEQIKQLNQIKNQLYNQGNQQQLTEQIRVLEQTNQEIETLLTDAQKGFSLFGWLNKLIS
ncbi:MAG TPA: hypothetical protein P5262_01710 [Candidatus Moranbacteria bacterium]|nr:hypothetical protein [Candidatus Moranbacteria bacterium]